MKLVHRWLFWPTDISVELLYTAEIQFMTCSFIGCRSSLHLTLMVYDHTLRDLTATLSILNWGWSCQKEQNTIGSLCDDDDITDAIERAEHAWLLVWWWRQLMQLKEQNNYWLLVWWSHHWSNWKCLQASQLADLSVGQSFIYLQGSVERCATKMLPCLCKCWVKWVHQWPFWPIIDVSMKLLNTTATQLLLLAASCHYIWFHVGLSQPTGKWSTRGGSHTTLSDYNFHPTTLSHPQTKVNEILRASHQKEQNTIGCLCDRHTAFKISLKASSISWSVSKLVIHISA